MIPSLKGTWSLKGAPSLKGTSSLKGNPGLKGNPSLKSLKGTPSLKGLEGIPSLIGTSSLKGTSGLKGIPSLKGTLCGEGSWLENIASVQIFLFIHFEWLLNQYSWSRNTFLLQVWAPWGVALLVHCLPLKSRTRLACDVIHASATYDDLVHDVTYTECQTQNGSTHDCFHGFQILTNETMNWL